MEDCTVVFFVGLSRLLTYNPQTQQAEIERARTELGDDLDAAQEEILQIVLDNKRKFDQTVRILTRNPCGLKQRRFSENDVSFEIVLLNHVPRRDEQSWFCTCLF